MQSTGHTSTHERSFTLMHGSAMMYVIPALQWIHGRTANIVDWDPLESSPARALGCLPSDRRDGAPCQERQNEHPADQRLDVARLVYVDEQHHTDGELPSPDGPIHDGRQQHRNERARVGEPEQMSANLNLTSDAPNAPSPAAPLPSRDCFAGPRPYRRATRRNRNAS